MCPIDIQKIWSKVESREQPPFSAKGQWAILLAMWSLLQLLRSAVIVWQQPQTKCQRIRPAMFQQNFIYKNQCWAGLGPGVWLLVTDLQPFCERMPPSHTGEGRTVSPHTEDSLPWLPCPAAFGGSWVKLRCHNQKEKGECVLLEARFLGPHFFLLSLSSGAPMLLSCLWAYSLAGFRWRALWIAFVHVYTGCKSTELS